MKSAKLGILSGEKCLTRTVCSGNVPPWRMREKVMAGRSGKRRYFIAERREAYLAHLRRTANHEAAARAAGIGSRAARRFRQREPEFEALCLEAEAEAQRRLAGAESPFDGAGAFECIRRGADGRLKIQAQGRRRWSKAAEDVFFDVLRECGNISAAARAAGVTRRAVWLRRRQWPAFARRFEETMEECEIVLEYRVACLGTNWSAAAEALEEAGEDTPPPAAGWSPSPAKAGEEIGNAEAQETPPPRSARSPSPRNRGEELTPPFDPELAMRFLKWRADKKRGLAAPMAALPPAEEVRERIVRKVVAIKRHKALMAKRAGESDSSPPFGGEGDRA